VLPPLEICRETGQGHSREAAIKLLRSEPLAIVSEPPGHISGSGHLIPGLFKMKKTFPMLAVIIIALFFFSFCGCGHPQSDEVIVDKVPVKIYFSPNGGCTGAIVSELNKAKGEVLVQAYSFTSMPIAKALVEVHNRGVHTEIILAHLLQSKASYWG
jgi:phosphatidylserine/phosphatidylglycerophosphate/cardiolipin synthase-like enzyme